MTRPLALLLTLLLAAPASAAIGTHQQRGSLIGLSLPWRPWLSAPESDGAKPERLSFAKLAATTDVTFTETDLTAYWAFEDTSPFAEEVSGNDGTTGGTVTADTGISGNGVRIEAGGNYLTLNSQINLAGDCSWSAWVNYDTAGDGQNHAMFGIVGSNAGRLFLPVQSNAAGWALRNTSNVTDTGNLDAVLTTGTLIHIVFTRTISDGTVRWYRNGVLQADTGTLTGTIPIGQIGGANSIAGIDGVMDEVGVWSRVLTADEISDLYNSGVGLTYAAGDDAKPWLFFPINQVVQ